MKVFIVTSGEYSAYGIEAVCTTFEKAMTIKSALHENDRPRIEEWECDLAFDAKERGWKLYGVYFANVRRADATIHEEIGIRALWEENVFHVMKRGDATYAAWAPSEEAVLKVANEKRAQWLAEHPPAISDTQV